MEQLLLGMLQEQLGKYIVGFRKEMVNANILNGKGEITDLSLNCAAINQQLSNIMPFIELESVHISKVGFQVTSWTNLRKSPIMVDIEHINVHISEPLHYLYPSKKRQRIRHMTVSEMEQYFQQLQEECRKNKKPFVNPNKRGGYSLVDRILDNLHIEIKSIYVQFQTWGKFKTRRPGPWTPPTLQFKLRNLRYVSVDEYGQEGTPDENWAHNHRPVPRGQERTLLVFKKVSMEYDFGVKSADGTQHFSLLKGGQGVEPETSATTSQKPTTTTKEKDEQKKDKPQSPTAAEVIEALALGPVDEEVSVSPDAAAEMVAALAGESTNSKEMETASGPEKKEKPSSEAVEKKEEPSSSQEEPLDDATTSSPGPQHSQDPTVPQEITGDEKTKEGDAPSVTFPPTENGNKTSQENGDKTTNSAPETEGGAQSTSSPPAEDDRNSNYHDGNNQVVVQMAMKRRVRDGALLSAQVDTTLSKVEILVPAEVVPLLIHAALGLQFCFTKDRGFEDPLRHPDDHTNHNEASARNLYMEDYSNKTKENGGNDQNDVKNESPPENAEEGEEKESPKEMDPEISKLLNAALNVDTTTSDSQAPQATELLAAVDGESVSNADVTVSQPDLDGNQKESVAGEEGEQIKVPASVPDVLGGEGGDNVSITGDGLSQAGLSADGLSQAGLSADGLSQAGLSALGDTIAEDLADTDTLDDGSTGSQLPPAEEGRGFAKSIGSLWARGRGSVTTLASSITTPTKEASVGSVPVTPPKSDNNAPSTNGGVPPVDRAIIMLPNGLVIHEKLSFSVSVDRATVRGVYASAAAADEESSGVEGNENTTSPASEKYEGEQDRDKDDFIQVDSKGAVVELIWPKSNLKKGGYVQASVSYMSVQERHGRRIRTIVSGGVKQDPLAKPIEKSDPPLDEVAKEEAFPLFEDRAIREDPLDMRRSFPAQAVGLLATIDCQTRKKSPPPRSEEDLPFPTTIITSKNDNDSTSALPQTSGHVDNTTQEKEASADQEEVVDVIMVTIDQGVDQINVALDCDCWCRALRFFLNESGGGFDGRWFTGDWADLFTIEMLVHPNTPLELEDHLQPLTEFYLDENHFVSSDLLHINAKISSCELRIPAAIQENVRSCDIVVTVDETFMVASSDLPCEFRSGNIGSTFCQEDDPSDLPKEVKFPNDPSDVSVELQNSENPSKRQSVMMAKTDELVKAKSTFRLDVKLLGMSTQIVPVVPFFVSSQPRQLCAPTDMSIGFCFEGEPPENDDTNEIKMVLYSSVVIDHIETNLDLDLIAGAISTILHHVQVVKETVACAIQLIPMHVANDDDPSVASVSSKHEKGDELSTASSARIKKSLRGHHVLVRRQLHRSRETGGLQIASFLQVANYGFTLWRHNVAVYSPVRSAQGVANSVERQKLNFPLLKLLSFGAKNVEVGTELSFPDDERRLVMKCGVEEAQLRLCKLKEGDASESGDVHQPSTVTESENGASVEEDEEMNMSEEDGKVESSEGETGSDRYDMVDLFHVGRNVPLPPVDDSTDTPRQRAILLRCEEYYSGFRSRSLVAEVGTGGTASLCIDQIETVFVLVLEALIMPTWSKSIKFPLIEKRRFPERSVGALFHSLLPGPGGKFHFWRFLRKLIALMLPDDLRLLLLRARVDGMLVTLPTVKGLHDIDSESQKCELMLRYLDLVTWYISPENQFHDNILSVAAMEGKPWSSLVSTATTGINHRLSCRQSLHLTGNSNSTNREPTLNEILPEFAVAVEYLHAKLSASMENTLSLDETEQLRDCLRFLARFGKRCVDIFFHLRRRLAFLKRRGQAGEEVEEQSNCKKDNYQPINAACADMEKSVRTAKDFVLRMCRYFDDSVRDHDAALRQKDVDLERLQRLVFLKEKERVAAVTMASSPFAGWLRVGGTHQSGMRVATTSTLWRYWAVLRRDMLILYTAPGKYKPVDLVLLRGARLRVLAGGRSKWDLKRAFGVVESEGKTRFFVAESEVEYTGWTHEIAKIISFHSVVENENEMKTVASGAEIDGESIANVLSSDRDEESVGLDSAGPKTTDSGKSEREAAEGTGPSPKQGFRGKLANLGSSLKKPRQDTPQGSTENESASAQTKTQEAKSIDTTAGSVSEGVSSQPVENSEPPKQIAGQDANVSRRLQFGKVAGVGRAFMAATKKTGKEVAERTRRAASSKDDKLNSSSHNALQVISETSGEKKWTCPHCTYINKTKETDVDFLICAVCESASDAAEVEFEHSPDATQDVTNTSAEVLIVEDTEEDVKQEQPGSTDTNQEVFRRSQSTPMEQRDRVNSADSETDLFRRSQSSGSFGGLAEDDDRSIISDLAMDEISEAARSAGGRRTSRSRLGGLGASLGSAARRKSQARPPDEPEKKGWFARLGSSVSNQQEESDGFQKNQPALKLKNLQIDPSIDFVSNTPGSFNAPLRKLDGQCFVTICDCSEKEAEGYLEWIHKDGDESSVLTPPPQGGEEDVAGQVDKGANKGTAEETTEHLFCIQIFNGSADDARKQPKSQVIRSFSDVVSFHVEISEIVAELMHHPLFHERSLERTASGDMTSGLQNAMGISPLDCIRISGAFLAGIADARSSSSPVEIPLSRQAEVVMDFLNSTLECPLSSAGHFALKDFLSIQDFTSTVVWSAPVEDDLLGETTTPLEAQMEAPAPATKDDETPPAPQEIGQHQSSTTVNEQKKADVLMELSTSCMEELVIAEQNGRLATNLLGAMPTANSNWFDTASQHPSYVEPLLPNYVTENLQEAMHGALMKVMAERDEAHAQLVSASVLHAHTLEQERKKADRLSAKLEAANKLQLQNTNRGPLFLGGDRRKAQEEKEEREKLQKAEIETMQQHSDAEIVALCSQLSGEISSRTQAALEVIRLKESRTIERQHEADEKQALREELTRLKERLAYEELKTAEAQREAEQWKQYYEGATASKEGNRNDSNSQPEP